LVGVRRVDPLSSGDFSLTFSSMFTLNSALKFRPVTHLLTTVCAALVAVSAGGCVSAGSAGREVYVWAADYVAQEPSAADATYRIGVGDMLSVQVFDNERLSAKGRVRSDGKLSIPLINDAVMAGKTPRQAAVDVEKALRDGNLVLNPRVNVVVDEVLPVRVSVLGAVVRAGFLQVDPGSGVAEALAAAGGLNEFAHKDRIYVVRKVPAPVRIRFTFASLTDTGASSAFRLRQGDVIVVE
jgi:polysaccharide biosynthesis/export protein